MYTQYSTGSGYQIKSKASHDLCPKVFKKWVSKPRKPNKLFIGKKQNKANVFLHRREWGFYNYMLWIDMWKNAVSFGSFSFEKLDEKKIPSCSQEN